MGIAKLTTLVGAVAVVTPGVGSRSMVLAVAATPVSAVPP